MCHAESACRQLINVRTYNLGFDFSRSENPMGRTDSCEVPDDADIAIDTTSVSAEAAAESIYQSLIAGGYLNGRSLKEEGRASLTSTASG